MNSQLFCLFACTLIFAFISTTKCELVAKGIMRVPLKHMKTGLQTMLERGLTPDMVGGLYKMYSGKAKPWRMVLQDGKPAPANDTVALWKFMQTQFYAKIDIGKPGRTFKLMMNMDWSYSWVLSSLCPKTQLPCTIHQTYDHTRSKTYQPDNRTFNISGHVGFLSKDNIHVGQLNCTGQAFAELTKVPWIYSFSGVDGVLGLGLPELSPDYEPFALNFFKQNKLNQEIFSFYINRDPTTQRGGSLFFGGIDPKHNKTQFTIVPLNSKIYWQFHLDKIQIVLSKKSRIDICAGGCNAMADTSSNAIVGPEKDIEAINQHIGADKIWVYNRYLIPCVNEFKGPKLSFVIGNQEFQIKGQDYIQKIHFSGIQICLSAFIPASKNYPPNTWALGGAFLYRYYTAYDFKERKFMIADVA